MAVWRFDVPLELILGLYLAAGQTPSTPAVYPAEEHGNITLTCFFPDGTDTPPDSLHIDLMKVEPLRRIYFYDSKRKDTLFIDEFYRGRLHCDPSFIRNEPIKCFLTDARLNDTGTYQCLVVADRKNKNEICDIRVTASWNKTTEETSPPAIRERIGLYVGFSMFIVLIAVLLVLYLKNRNESSLQE